MIAFLTVVYILILLLLFKLKVVKPSTFWYLSVLVWVVFLHIVLFFPLQFWAPSGKAVVMLPTVEIIPNVSGQVIEINVKAGERVKQGDVLFRIDPKPFEYKIKQLEASLAEAITSRDLAKVELYRTRGMAAQSAAAQREVDQWQARFEGAEASIQRIHAQLDEARYDLEHATVKAPADGYPVNVDALRPGARVTNAPAGQAMGFIDDSERSLGAIIQQNHLRHITRGQPAEVIFKTLPGQLFEASVEFIVPGVALGQSSPGARLADPTPIQAVPFVVRLNIDAEAIPKNLPPGSVGNVSIYTDEGRFTHVIRRVDMRIRTVLNYILSAL